MSETNYLESSKRIYQGLKEKHLSECRQRSSQFITQMVDPQKINPEFRVLVGDLCYRLSHYRRLLNAEDKILQNSPYEIRSKMETELLTFYGDRIFEEINRCARSIESLCRPLSPEEHSAYKTYFQEYLLELLTFRSKASQRAYIKPNGYAGDYQLMEAFASDQIHDGHTLYDKIVYRWTVTWPSAAPVKSRLKVIRDELKTAAAETLRLKDRMRMLDLACGPSIPVQWFLKNPESDKLEIFFLDQDAEAIKNLQQRMLEAKEFYHRHTQCHYYNQPIQQLLSDPDSLSQLANQDFIVTSGLFDYLDNHLAKMLTQVLYSILNPGGVLLIGNLSPTEPTTVFQWYIVEWPLHFRSQEDLLGLAPEGSRAEILTEELGFNLFLKIRK